MILHQFSLSSTSFLVHCEIEIVKIWISIHFLFHIKAKCYYKVKTSKLQLSLLHSDTFLHFHYRYLAPNKLRILWTCKCKCISNLQQKRHFKKRKQDQQQIDTKSSKIMNQANSKPCSVAMSVMCLWLEVSLAGS